MKDRRALAAPCGLDCFNCDLYEKNLTTKMAAVIQTQRGVPKDAIPCKGCREQDGKHFHLPHGCSTLDCAKSRNVEFCCDCGEFPCERLAPLADAATNNPHNLKTYNLCRIKEYGIDRWIAEAGVNRKKYFEKKFSAGKGQADEAKK